MQQNSSFSHGTGDYRQRAGNQGIVSSLLGKEACFRSSIRQKITLPDLFAGKMHALVYRAWKNRVKGRDWYDFEWYVRKRVPLDFNHLQERIKEFNGVVKTKEDFLADLEQRLRVSDVNQVKADVLPFIRNSKELDIWSNDYFLQLMDMIRFEEE